MKEFFLKYRVEVGATFAFFLSAYLSYRLMRMHIQPIVNINIPKEVADKLNQITLGTVRENDTKMYLGDDFTPMTKTLKAGDRVPLMGVRDEYFKIDCDGIWVKKEDIEA